MRFRRKKGDEEEVVSGDGVPGEQSWTTPAEAAAADDVQDDTVDMEAVAPATPAGGAGREDDHGERTNDDSTTTLEQATEGLDLEATVEHDVLEEDEPAAVAASGEDEEKLSKK